MHILIIDDHLVLEEGIKKRVLKVFPKANCYFADNIKTAIAKTHQLKIDLILCDLELNNNQEKDGFDVIESILSFEPRTKAIAYTNYNSYRIMKKALNSGFLSFLDKGCSFKEFEETLVNVIENGVYKSKTMYKLYESRDKFKRTFFSDSIYGISALSEKELKITILSKKTTDKYKLGLIMSVKPSTIDTYYKYICDKLNLKHRQEVAFFSKEFHTELIKQSSIK